MTESLNSSNNWQELLAGYVLGNLSSEETIQFNQYLQQYPEAKIEVERLQMTLALLPLSLSEGSSPDHLKAKIRSSANATTEELEVQRGKPTKEAVSLENIRRRRSHVWHRISSGIAAAAIATLGWQTYRLQQQVVITEQQHVQIRQTHAQLRQAITERDAVQTSFVSYQETVSLLNQPDNRLLNLTGSQALSNASGSLVLVPSQQVAVLALHNLPAPPQGKLYQLWAVVNGQKVDCIKFRPNQDGTILLQMSAESWVETPMVVVTLEPDGATPQPTGEMVMSSPKV